MDIQRWCKQLKSTLSLMTNQIQATNCNVCSNGVFNGTCNNGYFVNQLGVSTISWLKMAFCIYRRLFFLFSAFSIFYLSYRPINTAVCVCHRSVNTRSLEKLGFSILCHKRMLLSQREKINNVRDKVIFGQKYSLNQTDFLKKKFSAFSPEHFGENLGPTHLRKTWRRDRTTIDKGQLRELQVD